MSTTPTTTVGKILDYQAKQVCYNVYSYFKKRKLDPSTVEYRDDINLIKTVAAVTGLSKSTVIRIVKEGNQLVEETGSGMFKLQDKKKHVRKKRIEVDKFTEGIIRRKVIQFYTIKNEVPSIRRLNKLLKEENILSCSNEYLRQLLHKLGFTNSDCGEAKGMILERPDIVTERFNYLKAILGFRARNRNIFFLNETKRWELHENEQTSNLFNMLQMPSLIIVHAGGGDGFIDGSLLMLKPKSKKNYKKDLAYEHFDNFDWIKDRVTSNIAPSSVIVMNTPYFDSSASQQNDSRPIASSTRQAMQEWLDRYNISYRATDSKAELLELINNEQKEKEYSIEKALEEEGHTILHVPQNHLDLNPVLVAWEELKIDLEETTPVVLFSNYSRENWEKCFERVMKTETEYYENDVKLDEAVNNLTTVKKEYNSEEDDEEEEDNNLDGNISDCDNYMDNLL